MFYTMTHNAQLTKACLTFMLPLPFVQAKLDGPPRFQLKVRGTQWTSSSKLLLKIPVLQAHFCWLGDLEKIICPGKESASGTIQGVYVYLLSSLQYRVSLQCVVCTTLVHVRSKRRFNSHIHLRGGS